MSKDIDIKKLLDSSVQVFKDCLLPNNCLVAAPTHAPYYPKDVKSYMYSWPGRDLGFSLAAMALLDLDYYEVALKWLWERAENFQTANDPQKLGLIFKNYHVNGVTHESQFQPDQGATLIWSIHFKNKLKNTELSDLEEIIVNRLAQGYVRSWAGNGFIHQIEDLWEERGINAYEGIFTYSGVSCVKGLELAYEMLKEESFIRTAISIREFMANICLDDGSHVPRGFSGYLKSDMTIDGSLCGLAWPFNIGFSDRKILDTLSRIEREITSEWGVYRYPYDAYEGSDGRLKANNYSGSWPLLTFWLSIAYSEVGNKEKGEKYFNMVFEKLENPYLIPEQIFLKSGPGWEGVKPLLWSHAMAIFAAWKLGKLNQ